MDTDSLLPKRVRENAENVIPSHPPYPETASQATWHAVPNSFPMH